MFSVSYHNQKSTNTTSQKLLSNQFEQSNGISKIKYFCQCDGKEVKICWSKGSIVQAAVKIPKKGFVKIPTDLLPVEFKRLSESDQFLNYLRNARIQLTRLHNGDQKLIVSQRLRGGIYHGNDTPTKVSPTQEAYAKILAFNRRQSPEGEHLEIIIHDTIETSHETNEAIPLTFIQRYPGHCSEASSSMSMPTFIHEPEDDLRTAIAAKEFPRQESHHKAFRLWMESEGLDSLIHALLQHATGDYQEEDFSSAGEIRDLLNQGFPDLTSEEILHDGDKRRIATLIYRQYETASLIREFSERIIENEQQEYTEARKLNKIEQQCLDFIRIFDEKGSQLFKEAKQDLGLEAIDVSALAGSSSSTDPHHRIALLRSSSSSSSGAVSSSGAS